jgi:threonylcarbamoyladenosine tRNA methylthiotransferase MtaB
MRVFFQTFGCKANQYDTELLRTKMESGGGVAIEDHRSADICVVNSCSVTATADRECRQFVRKLIRENPSARIVVTGCYPSHAPEELKAISPRVEVYSNKEKDNLPACLGFEVSPEAFGLARFSTRARAFVKIQDGCKAGCRYCIIPTTRPDYSSKPVENVLKEVKALVAEGHGEVVFTGIRLGLYRGKSRQGRESSPRPSPFQGEGAELASALEPRVNLTELLQQVIKLPGKFRVRLSSLEVTEVTDELIALAASSEKICRHFHIPMQSASDDVLKAMGRWYAFADYKDRVDTIRRFMPDCGLTADVMVGFPTETEEMFRTTLSRIEELGMSGLHVFRYSPRPGTPAAELPELPEAVGRDRSSRLIGLAETLKDRFRVRFAGATREALAEPSGEGWTDNYIRVATPQDAAPGSLVRVRI